ncbi:AaceriAFL187Cp [[Ashbya] aceris (nom. inval.)]|nr:AaceriAFL187Cp [[Ashbya] aceris (nom. inval.)]
MSAVSQDGAEFQKTDRFEEGEQLQPQTDGQRRWFPWFGSAVSSHSDVDTAVTESSVPTVALPPLQAPPTSLLQSVAGWMPFWRTAEDELQIDQSTEYHQLTAKQVQTLEQEALQAVARGNDSWCWHTEYLPDMGDMAGVWGLVEGELSVANTGSQNCQLPLKEYPVEVCPLEHQSECVVGVNNSVLLPGYSPVEYFHPMPWTTRIASAVRGYYEPGRESHLYLKKETEGTLKDKKVIIISIVGSLPERYEKMVLEKGCSARYLGERLSEQLQCEAPRSISGISIHSPLDRKPVEDCVKECLMLLCNWRTSFQEYDALFVAAVYHSVPLAIYLIEEIIKHQSLFQLNRKSTIGLLSFNSCLRGYQFWDHSVDTIIEEDTNLQAGREKILFQGASKIQREILSKLKNYGKQNTEESLAIKKSLDWLLYNCKSFKMTMVSTLHDNFMTVSQKLAIDYVHPSVVRHIWCDGEQLGLDLQELSARPEFAKFDNTYPRIFAADLDIPKERLFEVYLVSNILLAINLGHEEFIPILQLINPFYISRSFNEHTTPANIKKQIHNEQKLWLAAAESRWKNASFCSGSRIPADARTIQDLLQYLQYCRLKGSNSLEIRSSMYSDSNIYRTFVHNTIHTAPLLERQHVRVSDYTVVPQSIYNGVNQYDLVWKFHECLSRFIKLRNIPQQPIPTILFTISADNRFLHRIRKASFACNTKESLRRLDVLWHSYNEWKPQTKGLKQLQEILSVLTLYSTTNDLVKDIAR